jgi:hypothetical protein
MSTAARAFSSPFRGEDVASALSLILRGAYRTSAAFAKNKQGMEVASGSVMIADAAGGRHHYFGLLILALLGLPVRSIFLGE